MTEDLRKFDLDEVAALHELARERVEKKKDKAAKVYADDLYERIEWNYGQFRDKYGTFPNIAFVSKYALEKLSRHSWGDDGQVIQVMEFPSGRVYVYADDSLIGKEHSLARKENYLDK